MTLDQFTAIAQTRIPTPQEFVSFAEGQAWSIVTKQNGQAALRVPDQSDPLARALAKMMSREPYRTNVLQVIRANERQPGKVELPVEEEATVCPQCNGTWYCPRQEIADLVQSPHWCARPRCPFRTTTRNPNG